MNPTFLAGVLLLTLNSLSSQESGRIVHRKIVKKNLTPPFVGPDFEEGKQDYSDYLDNTGGSAALDDNIHDKKDADILTIEDTNRASLPKFKTSTKDLDSHDGVKYGKTKIVSKSQVIRNRQVFARYVLIMEVTVGNKDNKK